MSEDKKSDSSETLDSQAPNFAQSNGEADQSTALSDSNAEGLEFTSVVPLKQQQAEQEKAHSGIFEVFADIEDELVEEDDEPELITE